MYISLSLIKILELISCFLMAIVLKYVCELYFLFRNQYFYWIKVKVIDSVNFNPLNQQNMKESI